MLVNTLSLIHSSCCCGYYVLVLSVYVCILVCVNMHAYASLYASQVSTVSVLLSCPSSFFFLLRQGSPPPHFYLELDDWLG